MKKIGENIKENTDIILKMWHKEGLKAGPKETQAILEQAKVDWMGSLTDELLEYVHLTDGENEFTSGKLIVANALLGSLVEDWLMYFYSVYYKDFSNEKTKINKNPKDKTSLVAPNKLNFDRLIQFSEKYVWKESKDIHEFFRTVQRRRNIIHSFNAPKVELGDQNDFRKLVRNYDKFLENILVRLPEIYIPYD